MYIDDMGEGGFVGSEVGITVAKEVGEVVSKKEKVIEYIGNNSDLPRELIEKMVGETAVDTKILEYIDEDKELIRGDELDGQLVHVRITDYLPEDGVLLGSFDAQRHWDLDRKVESYSAYRSTVHAAISHPVRSHAFGNWEDGKYVVLSPFEEVQGGIRGFETNDVFSVGPTKLGKNLVIVGFGLGEVQGVEVHNPDEVISELLGCGVMDE